MIDNTYILCVLLWFIFGLQHSLFARPLTKRLINQTFGNSFETHFYPILYFISQCIVFLIIYDAIKFLKPTIVFFEMPEELKGYVFWFNRAANLFLIITVFHFDVGKFTGITQMISFFSRKQKNAMIVGQTKLNTNYLYRYIRHPMYLGILLVFVSSTTKYTDIFFINLISILFYIEVGSYFEEKSLIKKFGSNYLEYQSITRKYLPGVR